MDSEPDLSLGNYVVLVRILDKGRATPRRQEWRLYKYSPTGRQLVKFLGFDPDGLLKEMAAGQGDGEMLEWVQAHSKTLRSAGDRGLVCFHGNADGQRCRNASIYVAENVVVELRIRGTHKGQLAVGSKTIAPTGKAIDVPCVDVFRLESGKILSFNCYNSASVMQEQLDLVSN